MQRSIIAPAERVTNLRWGIAVLLGFGVLINYFDRVNLTVAGPALRGEFGLDDAGFGLLLSAFGWTYAILQIPMGTILDRYGPVLVGRISTLLWSVSSALTIFANGFNWIFASRLLLGIAEAPTFPINSKATGYWFPTKERGLATAIFDAAAKFGSAVGVPLVAIILTIYGWRATFAFTAILSFVFFLLFYAFYRNPSEDKRLTYAERKYITEGGAQPEGQPAGGHVGVALGYLLRQRKVWGVTIAFAAYDYAFYLFLTWLPGYLGQTYHISVIKSGWYASAPWLVATISDLLVGGWLIDALIQRGYDSSAVRRGVVVIGMLLGLAVVGATTAHDPTTAVVWISISLAGLAAAAPVFWSIPSLIAPRGSVGTVGGIMNFFGNLMVIAAPIVTGFIARGTGAFTNAFLTAGVILVIGILAYVLVLGRVEPIPEPAA
ncbi:MAG TPA: MFS transporter [Candidatus Acidoferrum sp.]|nr:MFS transporter [Candidatus Acidoferrum sp.]